jgi:hypothetical protein
LSSAESQDGSQAPAVLPNKRWSRRWHSGASAQGVPAVSVSSKPIAADAIEYGNHAASRTSRTVNAARYAHIADSVLEACLGCNTRAWRPYRRFRREAAPSSEGFDWYALMRCGAEFRACDVRDMSAHPGLRGRTVRRQDAHGRERPAGGAVPDRQPRGEAFTATRRQPFQPITTCQHFPGGQAMTTRANGEEGLRARGRHPGGRRRVVHSPVHQ